MYNYDSFKRSFGHHACIKLFLDAQKDLSGVPKDLLDVPKDLSDVPKDLSDVPKKIC